MMNFEEANDNMDYRRIMDKVGSRYNRAVDQDELESLKLLTLWECTKNYDPSRNMKFTSYLYQQLDYKIKNFLKKRSREFTNSTIEAPYTPKENFEILIDGLNGESQSVLRQKFLGNMTMEEIGKANGYSRETARRKVKKALCQFQKIKNERWGHKAVNKNKIS
jgi:RNA polymerase sigma factor (sigma-70 family)